MHAVFICALACLVMAGCDASSPPKPSPYRYMASECAEVRSAPCPINIPVHS
jgi:hypothetical protein